MKTRALYLAVASTLVVLAGCKDDDLTTNPTPWHEGDDITFNVRAGFENEESTRPSRTLYTDDEYNVGDKTYERVEWVIGDQVRIYCEQANNPQNSSHWSDYQVTARTHPEKEKEDYATLDRLDGEGASLQWGSADQDHTFYAVYPSPGQNPYAGIDKNVVTGVIPAAQAPSEIEEGKTEDGKPLYDCKPNMDYAYMVAKSTVPAGGDRNVNLSFQSIATALELELIGPNLPNTSSAETITDVIISSYTENTNEEPVNINGAFTCDLDQTGDDGYPVCDMAESSEACNQINVSLVKGGKGIEMKDGYKIKLTVFLLPVEDLSKLRITIVSTKGRKTHNLVDENNTDITLKAHLKHLVHSIQIPEQMDASKWISQLNDNILLSQLSIPGTNASYSYTYEGNESKYFQAQTLTIQDQWNLGIRCFEITCDRQVEATGSLGDSKIQTSSVSDIKKTVDAAVTEISKMVTDNPTEFAIIILSYQPGDQARDGNTYASNFVNYFNKLTSINKKLFSPGLTVGEARGNIMFLFKPTSDGEDELTESTQSLINNKEFVSIIGWGSLHDKWKHRGYPVSSDNGHTTATTTMEYSMLQENTSSKTVPTFKLPQKGTADYTYETNNNFTAWVQEWPRVVEKDFTKVISTYSNYHLWVKWAESYKEKLDDAKLTFDKAINDRSNVSSIYINSLAGYFIDEGISEIKQQTPAYEYTGKQHTYGDWGGSYGDLETFSNRINGDFYTYVLKKANSEDGSAGITGPMGIVLMNRVGNEAVPGSMYMPNVVISNNFKFPLLTSESTGGTTSKTNGNTYQQGGNAIR